MQAALRAVLALAIALPALGSRRGATQVTPVQKVIELLEGMTQKGKDEMKTEQIQFAHYKQFCEDTTRMKQEAIAEAGELIEKLTADIEVLGAHAEKLTKEIAAHDEDIFVWENDVKAATKVRNIEVTDYDATHQDYSESVDALQRAIAILKSQAYNRPQAQASLVQLSKLLDLNLIPKQAKQAIDKFLQQDPSVGLEVTAPEAHGYEFQSHGVIEMLEKLLDKFVTERTDLEKEEMDSKHAFELLMQDMDTQITQAKEDRTRKSAEKASTLEKKANTEGDLSDTKAMKEADETYLADLTATCEQKATDFESRQTLRTQELEAIAKAIEILSSNEVKGHAETYLPTLLQRGAGTALAALRSEQQGDAQARAGSYLQSRAKQLGSRVLAKVATHVAADPFAKVKKMIKDLLVRLMEEATEEAEHKGWCDQELATNARTRQAKTEAVEMLHAEIDQLETSIQKLSEDLAELTKAVAELDAAMAKATELRAKEKEENEKTVADAKEAQTAVAQALTVLSEFYAKAGEATALVQQPFEQPVAPEIFDSPYKGMQAEHGGVVGMLEVIQSDFARLEADTENAEASAQQEYDTFMTDSKVDKAAKTKDIEHKTAKKQEESQALVDKKSDLEGTQKDLDAAMAYFDKLKPSCVDAGVTYEARVARRKEEIESLQEALRILNGEDLA